MRVKHLSTLLFGATAISCVAGATAPSTTPVAPADSPEATIATYFKASDTGSSQLLRAAFHPAAQMQWIDDTGAAQLLTQLAWWRRLDARTPSAPPTPATGRRFEVLDREGPLALVEAVSAWPTHVFDDLMLVVRTPDGWRIVGKVFEKRAPDAVVTADPEDDAEIRRVVAEKIEAHMTYDPALLASSHTAQCLYVAIGVRGSAFTVSTLSEAAARYAKRREAGETDRTSPWRVLRVVVRDGIAAVKLDVIYEGKRLIDHLLLMKTSEGWRIAAASWGDPRAESH